ncbi:MAG: NAD(P)-binding domain-containing protein [Proteobacteria bacterium]|nr:NAD(P)-binding domain-containing protein [Pseudomonadota bacterium]
MEYLVYLVPLLACLAWYFYRRFRLVRVSKTTREESHEAGLTEPASLHPLVDPKKCIGCGSCIKACPEMPHHTVLGLINSKADLVSPTECIGHGACRAACPVDAITLVFGTARRGVDLPRVTPWFETNVAGVFVAGELGGMGLIRNAVEQGRQALEQIVARRPRGRGEQLDLVIVGAGPAGFSASLAALEKKLRFVTLEQESLGGCVFQYPRGKIVMTQPATLPLVGKMNMTLTSKEQLLEFWLEAQRRTGLEVRCNERVEAIARDDDGFVVRTTQGELRAATVLLAVGRRGTPRKLGVPGEDLPKVVYRLIDPDQYRGQRVLVVGGGDSALEAAASLAESGAMVALSYRGDAFQRAKTRNRDRIAAAVDAGRLQLLLKSEVKAIAAERVAVVQGGRGIHLPNDAVIVNAGGILPTDFLKSIGIEVETKWGTA